MNDQTIKREEFSKTENQLTLTLKEPIAFGSDVIHELILMPLKAKHLRGLPAELDMDALLTLAGRLTGQPPKVMDELCMADFQALMEAIACFLDGGLKIGRNH